MVVMRRVCIGGWEDEVGRGVAEGSESGVGEGRDGSGVGVVKSGRFGRVVEGVREEVWRVWRQVGEGNEGDVVGTREEEE